ncbi:helix-turn-helix transcriptional regulator [Paenibacillus sp. JDR-2]|uniref:helix-turn-helix transcriptional regulator n=1 Tax=Paenibacillus sp. (strain JDR-2) TaxID=324057 RepID=UPI000166AE0C|nr:YafY family protein [Paenibacillus sp. JDR-2]ACT04604.1 Helix-turn-helix type 11 domain protein [Paenibacillus sp. JDR-2]
MRADRLISILMLLQLEGKKTAAELAERLEVSERTIYRDMDALSLSGVPVYADSGAGGGFSLPPNYKSPIDGLTTPEIQALFLYAAEGSTDQLGIVSALRSALLKLMQALPEQSREDAAWIRQRIHIDPDSWQREEKALPHFAAVQESIMQHYAVEISYRSRDGAEKSLTVKPYGLVAKAGIWFLIGEGDQGVQAYRLSRIQGLKITEEKFERPESFDLQGFWKEWVTRYEARIITNS